MCWHDAWMQDAEVRIRVIVKVDVVSAFLDVSAAARLRPPHKTPVHLATFGSLMGRAGAYK